MRTRTLSAAPLVATLIAAAALTSPASKAGPSEKLAKNLSANWDFRAPKKYHHALCVIRQENNRIPGIYAGRNEQGKFSLIAKEDQFTDELTVSSTGGFSVRLTVFPPKQGMEDLMPGYAWAKLGKETKVSFEFTSFKNWNNVGDKRKDADGTSLTATYTGVIHANGKDAPISGTATFFVPHKVGVFSFTTTFKANGSDLGLPATQQGPLEFTLRTSSPASSDLPVTGGGMIEIDTN